MSKNATEQNGAAGSGPGSKIVIVLLVAIAAGAVHFAKQEQGEPDGARASNPEQVAQVADDKTVGTQAVPTKSKTLPRLIDLGADKCVPCKMMAPILEELKTEYAGKFEVQFIDVWKNPDAGEEYGMQIIPTQIFYDASGEERFRHQGFFSKEDILATWKELGVD